MSKLVWDQTGEKLYETGVEQAAMYKMGSDGTYGAGEAWNGLTGVTESPSGAEPTALWANDHKYLELRSAEEFGGTIEAYTFPEGFNECNGAVSIAKGVRLTQQVRKPFGLVYKSLIGNDTEGTKHGYNLNIVYNAVASPSEKANTSISDSPEAATLSWEFTTTPVSIPGYDPCAHIVINSTEIDADKLAAIEAILYGSDSEEARMILPDELITLMGTQG